MFGPIRFILLFIYDHSEKKLPACGPLPFRFFSSLFFLLVLRTRSLLLRSTYWLYVVVAVVYKLVGLFGVEIGSPFNDVLVAVVGTTSGRRSALDA